MKKTLCLLLVMMMLFTLAAGCGDSKTPAPEKAPAAEPSEGEEPQQAPAAEAPAPEKVYTMTLSTQAAENSTDGIWLKQVAEKIKETTNGQVAVEIYWSSTLVGETDVVSAIRGGLCDIGHVSMGRNATLFPVTSLIMEPYSNLGSGETFYENVFSKLWADYPELQKEYEGFHICAMYLATNGGTVHAVKEIRVPGDMAGLKLSTVTPFQTNMTEFGGGAPMSIEASEWYTSFQYGVADGMWMTWGAITGMNLYEVLPYHTIFPNGTDRAMTCLLFNQKAWDKLPADCQEAIDGVVSWSCSIWPDIEAEDFETNRSVMEEAGCTFIELTPEEEAQWSEAAAQFVQQDIASIDGQGLPGSAFYESLKAYGAEN